MFKGKSAEIAFGVSGLLLVGGLAADAQAEHISLDKSAIERLSDQKVEIQAHLDEAYPALEALKREDDVTVREAKEYGADTNWYSMQNQLSEVEAQLDDETHGNRIMNQVSKVVWGVGGIVTAGSWMVLKTKADEAHSESWRAKAQAQSSARLLAKAGSLEGMVFGLESEGKIPVLDASGFDLSIFTERTPYDGMAQILLKSKQQSPRNAGGLRTNTLKSAKVALRMHSGIEDDNEHDLIAARMIEPLFGAMIERVGGSYDASDLASRIDTVVSHLIDIYSQPTLGLIGDVRYELADEKSHVEYVAHLLDSILPLDQNDERNPACYQYGSDDSRVVDGRHWIDFIENRSRAKRIKTEMILDDINYREYVR